ncbi:hypothetical protein E5Q_01657 [Mixia osmundae IAM 14324]|uniref:V-type proton ATPase subunit C n=1 Tax=Mixia osmundae (strain CBS 9802 / IAM 14324 / JCM 22182 / KY 12970) TaxID=764103 RepID=G7DWQ5_MIXOS|nr:hypothetical protein E5Q_01657 [Mixia osmundae IAM 14324]
MSAASGISLSTESSRRWTALLQAGESGPRAVQVKIISEVLELTHELAAQSDALDDFDLLPAWLGQSNEPAYILHRLDSGSFVYISFVPDDAPVRSKMLYASSRATLQRQLGDQHFTDSLFATRLDELTSSAYRAHLQSQSADAPLTERERESADIKKMEGRELTGTSARGSAGKKMLSWSDEAMRALEQFASSDAPTLHLVIELKTEVVQTAPREGLSALQDTPSYILHRLSRANESAIVVFIYVCPTDSPVRSRMIYSSTVVGAVTTANDAGCNIAKRLETSDPSEVTEAWITQEMGFGTDEASQSAPPPASKTISRQIDKMSSSDLCPVYAPFFGSMGCTAAIVFTCIGASYGTSKSGVGISAMGVLRPDLMMKCIVPVVMAGIIAIYGLVVSVLISGQIESPMALYTGFIQLGAGLSVGLAGLSAGFAIGIVGDAGVRGTAQQPRLFVGMILILIFAEVLGLYGTAHLGLAVALCSLLHVQASLSRSSSTHARKSILLAKHECRGIERAKGTDEPCSSTLPPRDET